MSWRPALALVMVFVLLLTVFSLSAFAEDAPYPVPAVVPSTPLSIFVGTQPLSRYGSYSISVISGTSPTYVGYIVNPNSTEQYYVGVASSSQVSVLVSYSTDEPDVTIQLSRVGTIYAATSLNLVIISSSVPTIPVYSNASEFLQAVQYYFDNPPSSSSTSSFQYSLPPGNVAYIEMGSSSAIKLSMDFPELSNTFGTPFSKANSAYALVDSLPTVGSSVASGTVIPWVKSGRLNLIGQTSEASFGPVGPIASRYVAVINPSYYDHVLATGTYRQNPPIQIDALNVLSIQVYPLQSAYTFDNDTGQVTTTIAGDAYVGDVDADTGDIYWTDPDGGSSAPDLGGNNLPEAGNSIFDTLRNIASDFSEFLKGPVSAVRVVVSSIREFMSSFTQLYTWLPSPVYNLITSALMIAITIGVIKIFV